MRGEWISESPDVMHLAASPRPHGHSSSSSRNYSACSEHRPVNHGVEQTGPVVRRKAGESPPLRYLNHAIVMQPLWQVETRISPPGSCRSVAEVVGGSTSSRGVSLGPHKSLFSAK